MIREDVLVTHERLDDNDDGEDHEEDGKDESIKNAAYHERVTGRGSVSLR